MSTLSRATGTTRERRARDFYPTIDPRAVAKLVPHLEATTRYVEPCAGGGHLIDQLALHGMQCMVAMDLEPQRDDVMQGDALSITGAVRCPQTGQKLAFITNPPWDRQILHALIDHLSRIAPTWFLFDAAWKETGQAAPFGDICVKIVSVGRLKWIEGSKHNSTDDCSWYLFDANRPEAERGQTQYVWPAPIRYPAQMVLI